MGTVPEGGKLLVKADIVGPVERFLEKEVEAGAKLVFLLVTDKVNALFFESIKHRNRYSSKLLHGNFLVLHLRSVEWLLGDRRSLVKIVIIHCADRIRTTSYYGKLLVHTVLCRVL
jgi:hypothetical protein